jgi:seryl-tRNA synthetase
MIVVCKPEDAMKWYEKLWRYSVELFRSLDIPVRQLECCSGDLADLKVKSCDIEAWSPRQQKYFEVCSCSNLGDAQARRLNIRYKDEDGKLYLCHTLNNTCVAPPRMLIAFLENHLQKDGTVTIPGACSRTWAARPCWCRIKALNAAKRKLEKPAEPAAPAAPEPSNEEKLLTEIRDLLKNQK